MLTYMLYVLNKAEDNQLANDRLLSLVNSRNSTSPETKLPEEVLYYLSHRIGSL